MSNVTSYRLGVRPSGWGYISLVGIFGVGTFVAKVWPKSDVAALAIFLLLLLALALSSRTMVELGQGQVVLRRQGLLGRSETLAYSAVSGVHLRYVSGTRPEVDLELADGSSIVLGPWDPLLRGQLIRKCEALVEELSGSCKNNT